MNHNLKFARLYLSISVFVLSVFAVKAQEVPYIKVLFENSQMPGSYYNSSVSYTGKSWVKHVQNKMPVTDIYSFTPKNALELSYVSSKNDTWSATVSYKKIRGIDFFKPATHLSFWMYLENAENINTLPKVAVLYDKESVSKVIELNQFVKFEKEQWQQVLIPLVHFSQAVTVENLVGVQFLQGNETTQNNTLFIDQIELISVSKSSKITQTPQIINSKGYERHVDVQWQSVTDTNVKYIKIYRSNPDGTFKPVGIQPTWISGYSDYVGETNQADFTHKITFLDSNYNESPFSNTVASKTQKLSDDAFLDMIQEANFRYYWDGAEPNSGLAFENIPGRTSMIATGASGFGMMALIAGVERGFITRDEAVERFLKITRYLNKADRFHGVFPHFLDGVTGKVVPFFGKKDNGGDLVEHSFLMQGLLTAHQYFSLETSEETEIRTTISNLWNDTDWAWYKRYPDAGFLLWHWSPDQEWVIDHKLIGWNETMITYFLAIASPTHSVPASIYYTGWASPSQEAQDYRSNWGKTLDGSHYKNGNTYFGIELPVGVSNGGPLFFVHYSYFGLNPHKVTDKYVNYFENNKRIAQINQRYCIENPKNHQGYGEDFWGLTASDGSSRYSANEPNVANDEGKMTPTGALSSFPYTPDASMKALKNYYYNYGHFLYGYYGFKDAVVLDDNWCSPLYMGLNQAPIVIMIENYRSQLLWNLFMSHDDIKLGLEKLDKETLNQKSKQ